MDRVAGWYAKFRGSRGFLFGLIVFVGTWLAFHFIFGFDVEFGELNTILSTEASISLAFFTMVSDVQAGWVKTIILEIKDMGGAILNISMAQRDVLVDIQSTVDEVQTNSNMLLEEVKLLRTAVSLLTAQMNRD